MNWNSHWDLQGKHSFLSPSSHHWMNYTTDKLRAVYLSRLAKERGTRLHALASELIQLGIRLPRNRKTLNAFVNDAIAYHMRSEQPLYFSDYCFGTADAISYDTSKHLLRIHDLKTGVTPASLDQLLVYDALFCLEYRVDPATCEHLLRIYQNDDVNEINPSSSDIKISMDQIIDFSQILSEVDLEVADE